MDPIMAAQALRLIAQKIELSRSPSISEVTSELEQILQYVGSEDVRIAGPVDWMKGLKRKVLNTKGEKKILDRIDHLESLMSWSGSVAKKVRKGEDMADIASDEDYLQVLDGASEFMTGGSEALTAVTEADEDVGSALAELDEYWLENEDSEERDREIIVNALSEFHSKSEKRIQKNHKLLQKQKIRQKKKGLPLSKDKRRKPKEP